jgi:hypothetical protein
MKRNLTLILFGCFLLTFSVKAQEGPPLTLFQIEKALQAKQITLKERNRLLIEGVKERGVTFSMYISIARRLTELGATTLLIEILQDKAPPMPTFLQNTAKLTERRPTLIQVGADIEFRLIPKGEFMMGAKENEAGSSASEKPQHLVQIPKLFYLGKYEITQKQWKAVMGNNPSQNKECGEECPVENVSWDNVQEFIKKLNEINQDNFTYRLPTEAEWEYAARATSATRFYWGDDNDGKMWRTYVNINNSSTALVGSYLPNGYGLYDMSGNVWEFVEDVWQPNYGKSKNDGSANLEGDPYERVIKGGSLTQSQEDVRPARRVAYVRDKGSFNIGFRLVAIPKN